MATMIRVLLDMYRMTAANFLARANAVFAGLNLNPAYPKPPIPMPEFRLAIDNYSAAVTAALDGGAKAIAQRNALGEALRQMMRQLAHYVEANCGADMAVLLSSGFQAATTVPTRTKPLTESIRKIEPGPATGQLLVSLVAVPGAVSYELHWAPIPSGGTPGAWTNQPVARVRPPALVPNLTPGTAYVLQARALTASGFTDWSDSVTRICI